MLHRVTLSNNKLCAHNHSTRQAPMEKVTYLALLGRCSLGVREGYGLLVKLWCFHTSYRQQFHAAEV